MVVKQGLVVDMKFQNEFYATGVDGEVHLVDPKGNVLNKKANSKKKLVHSVGVNDWKFSVGSSEGGMALAYKVWAHMLERGYDKKFKSRQPTYIGVSVSEEWLSFSTFFNDTKQYMKQGYQLDKDLIFFDNKEYNKDSCIFVPSWLNVLLLDRGAARGDLPQGVCLHKETGRYAAHCKIIGVKKHLGYFISVEDASANYVDFKIGYIESKRVEIEEVANYNDLHIRFGKDFSLTDRVIENFKKQVFY